MTLSSISSLDQVNGPRGGSVFSLLHSQESILWHPDGRCIFLSTLEQRGKSPNFPLLQSTSSWTQHSITFGYKKLHFPSALFCILKKHGHCPYKTPLPIHHWSLIPLRVPPVATSQLWLKVLLAGPSGSTPLVLLPLPPAPQHHCWGVRLLSGALGLMAFAALPLPSCYKALA